MLYDLFRFTLTELLNYRDAQLTAIWAVLGNRAWCNYKIFSPQFIAINSLKQFEQSTQLVSQQSLETVNIIVGYNGVHLAKHYKWHVCHVYTMITTYDTQYKAQCGFTHRQKGIDRQILFTQIGIHMYYAPKCTQECRAILQRS